MQDINYEALAFFLALFTLICTGLYKSIGWIIKVNRELEALKRDQTRLTLQQRETNDNLSKLNETVKNFGIEVSTQNGEIIQMLLTESGVNDD